MRDKFPTTISNHSFKLALAILIFLTCFTDGAAQSGEKKNLIIKPIENAMRLVDDKRLYIVQAITRENDTRIFWSFNHCGDSIHAFRLWYYIDNNLYTELYIEKNSRLVHAREEVVFLPLNHSFQSVWICRYYLDKEKVIHHISHGHGKTEDDAWNPNDIVAQFGKRKKQSQQISKIYDPK